MLWVLKRKAMSFQHLKHMFKSMGKKITANLRFKICLRGPLYATVKGQNFHTTGT